MVAKKSGYNPVKKGYDPRQDASNGTIGNWLKVEPNSAVDIVCLVSVEDIVSVEQCAIWLKGGENSPVWVYTGDEDPYHDLGMKPKDKRYRAYLPVIADDEIKVWSMGKQAHQQLLDTADASGDIKGMLFRIKRTGEGLKTRYSIIAKGKRKDVDDIEEVDVISMLGPLTPDGVKKMLAERFDKEDYDEFLASYKGKGGKTKKKIESEDDLEEIDDMELA